MTTTINATIGTESMSYDAGSSAVAKLLISQANAVDIHTGNIINWNMLKKRSFHHSMTSSDELTDALHSAIESWTRNISVDHSLNISESRESVDIANRDFETPIDPNQRDKLKLSVKLFLYNWRPEVVRQAVDKIIQNLSVQRIDSVIISLPITLPSTTGIAILEDNNNISPIVQNFDKVQSIWEELQSTVDSGHVTAIGVCDFDQKSMELLYNWARIKPTINQINLTNCCAVPTDLIQYSREENIELLTHNDPPEILSASNFQSLVSETSEDNDATDWMPSYIARYSVLVRYRGIVHSKGYAASAQRGSVTANSEDYSSF